MKILNLNTYSNIATKHPVRKNRKNDYSSNNLYHNESNISFGSMSNRNKTRIKSGLLSLLAIFGLFTSTGCSEEEAPDILGIFAEKEESKGKKDGELESSSKETENGIPSREVSANYCDFQVKLNGNQKYAAKKYLNIWSDNKDKYRKVEKETNVPAELIWVIHCMESSGNFETYLHNGQPLGKTTTIVPKGIYFDNWEDAAVDAMARRSDKIKKQIDLNKPETLYNFLENYNGMGYSKYHNMNSPYVWAGTNLYTKGRYVADGKFDPNAVSDKRPGGAVLLALVFGQLDINKTLN